MKPHFLLSPIVFAFVFAFSPIAPAAAQDTKPVVGEVGKCKRSTGLYQKRRGGILGGLGSLTRAMDGPSEWAITLPPPAEIARLKSAFLRRNGYIPAGGTATSEDIVLCAPYGLLKHFYAKPAARTNPPLSKQEAFARARKFLVSNAGFTGVTREDALKVVSSQDRGAPLFDFAIKFGPQKFRGMIVEATNIRVVVSRDGVSFVGEHWFPEKILAAGMPEKGLLDEAAARAKVVGMSLKYRDKAGTPLEVVVDSGSIKRAVSVITLFENNYAKPRQLEFRAEWKFEVAPKGLPWSISLNAATGKVTDTKQRFRL